MYLIRCHCAHDGKLAAVVCFFVCSKETPGASSSKNRYCVMQTLTDAQSVFRALLPEDSCFNEYNPRDSVQNKLHSAVSLLGTLTNAV